MKLNLLKKLLAGLLIVCLLAVVGCGGADTPEVPGEDETPADETPADETPTETGLTVTFETDEHVTVTVYKTQADLTNGENGTVATSMLARDGETGEAITDGNGQANFLLTFEDGYVLDDISVDNAEGYNKVKGKADTGVENGYRITKISADLKVTITAKAAGAVENLDDGYAVTFVVDEHATVTVYKTQDLAGDSTENATVAYSRDSATGALTKTDGQVNFLVVVEDGYEIASVVATPEDNYKNLKDPEELGMEIDFYRLTKIKGEVTVTITTVAK